MEAYGSVANQETLDGASEEDCLEMVVHEDDEEADLRGYEKQCPKAARHKEFIPVSQFCLGQLPEQYRTDKMLACMKALIGLTVLLNVTVSSDEGRGSETGKTPKKKIRRGSGFVFAVGVFPGNKVCPCGECMTSGNPNTHFAEITVKTASHIIPDKSEGKNATCYFDCDSDETDPKSCLQLSNAVNVFTTKTGDFSQVLFVTHDLQFATKLRKSHEGYIRDCCQLKFDLEIMQDEVTEMSLPMKFSNLCEESRRLLKKIWQGIDRLNRIVNGGGEQMLGDSEWNLKLQEATTVIYEKFEDGTDGEHLLSQAYGMSKMLHSYYDKLQGMKDNCKAKLDQHERQSMLDTYTSYRNKVVMIKKRVQVTFEEPSEWPGHTSHDDEPIENKFYNSSHPFTIIVSHPHGLGKKISLGNVTKRIVSDREDLANYNYKNTTCQGSSGGPVFIMGRLGLFTQYSHRNQAKHQTNHSAISFDH